VTRFLDERGQAGRLILGNDAPSGTGVVTLGILRNVSWLASLGGLAPEVAICCATGNTAKLYGLNRGLIAPGREADLVFMDAPMGCPGDDLLAALKEGDTPGVSMVVIDGEIAISKSRNTPPPVRKAALV